MITVIRRSVVKKCPFKDETDYGELVITFAGPAPELHELGAEIDAINGAITHESYTVAVAALVPGARVTTTWSTGPWAVEVEYREVGDPVLRQPVDTAGA